MMEHPEASSRIYRQFFSSLGFDEDPFAYTNADEEDRLQDYFIPPPYFPSVFGNPERPKSFVAFAPRGGGKSAQRRMIEAQCMDSHVLAVTYDRFEFAEARRVIEVTLHHHLRNVLRFSLMGLLITLHSEPALKDKLTKHDREIIVKLAADHLSGITEVALKQTLDSLKSLKEKVQDFWNEWLPLISVSVNLFLKKLLGVDADLDRYQSSDPLGAPSLKYQLELVVGLARKVGFSSIYVLLDRVDEAELTGNNALNAFKLVEPMLRDLELLEFDGIGFKFFLWDQLEPLYLDIARTDRIRHETLEWHDGMLMDMWRKRLSAYSGGEVSGLDSVSEKTSPYSLDQLALIFANCSPRDMIRIGAQVVAEQQQIDRYSGRIESEAIYTGIEKFCARRAAELVTGRTLDELKRIGQVDFTIPYLANDVFRETSNGTRNRIFRWRQEGAIDDLERVENPNPQQTRPVKLFAIRDVRIAQIMFPGIEIPSFLASKYRQCSRCGATVLRDWGDRDSLSRCLECQYDLLSEDEDVWDDWKRKDLASQVRRRRRRERIEATQSSFDDIDWTLDEGEG